MKEQKSSKIRIVFTSGNDYLKSNGKKEEISASYPTSIKTLEDSQSVPLHNKDVIITEEGSYAIDISDQRFPNRTHMSLFPNSSAQILTNASETIIKNIHFQQGLFYLDSLEIPKLPNIKIKNLCEDIDYLDNSVLLWIDIQGDYLKLALENGWIEITHSKTGKKDQIMAQEQVNVTATSLKKKTDVDERFKDAHRQQQKFRNQYYTNIVDISFQQQKVLMEEMRQNIADMKKDIVEIKEETGNIPFNLQQGVKVLQKQLREAEHEFEAELERRKHKDEKEKELSEFQKKFEKKEKKFAADLEKMASSLSTGDSLQNEKAKTSNEEDMTELERKIQNMGSEISLESLEQEDSGDQLTELERKIQNMGSEISSESTEQEDSEDDLTDLERKIQNL